MDTQSPEAAFERDISKHTSLIRKVCRIYAFNKADRDDLQQEIIMQLWRSYKKFRGESQFSTWVYRIAINTAITGLQKQSRRIRTSSIENLHESSATENSAENEQWQELQEAIKLLNDVEKAIVMLYLEDLSYDEMEAVLGIRESTLRVKMNRIKQKLKKTTQYGTR